VTVWIALVGVINRQLGGMDLRHLYREIVKFGFSHVITIQSLVLEDVDGQVEVCVVELIKFSDRKVLI
jgi:hypothetical protein